MSGFPYLCSEDVSDHCAIRSGFEYPVHPLDVTTVGTLEVPDANGNLANTTVCYNTYQYTILIGPSFSGQDLVLGDSFLRNVYAS